jgi:nucleoside-diphosphate-sugar epimerase
MDKAIIFGVFEFLGFHFCKKLLDEGVEVEGIHILEEIPPSFCEEKRMEIGRNANFTEVSSTDWKRKSHDKESIVFLVDYYDLFIRNNEDFITHNDVLKEVLISIKNGKEKVVFLLPIQLLVDKTIFGKSNRLNEIFKLLKGEGIVYQIFYLPTIYGPWQPMEFAFQKFFLQNIKIKAANDLEINEREWVFDAIFVEDTVNGILQYINESSEEFILKSGEENNWERCAKYLSIPWNISGSLPSQQERHIPERVIRESHSYQKRLDGQRQQLGMIWKNHSL